MIRVSLLSSVAFIATAAIAQDADPELTVFTWSGYEEDAYWANVDADYRAGLRFGIERAPTLIWPRHLPEDTSGFAEVAFPGQSA